MSDREMLELAAKAAGIDTTRCLQYEDGAFDWPGKAGRWNPLTDDGDALRLAVKLEIDLAFEGSPDIVWADDNWSEPAGVDRQAATRRAIVRAAAEIGKGMK